MSVNTKAGFSIVKYEGNGSAGAKIAHGLNSAPEMIILKGLENTYQWETQHKDISLVGAGIHLDSATAYNSGASDRWNSQRADSKVVTVSSNGAVNETGKDYIMYSWHSVPGYSAFGKYTGNNGGNFIYTGFRPAFVMFKKITPAESWVIADNARDPDNPTQKYLIADTDGIEGSQDGMYDFLSNGFVMKTQTQNNSGQDFIYVAFAETPLNFANAR